MKQVSGRVCLFALCFAYVICQKSAGLETERRPSSLKGTVLRVENEEKLSGNENKRDSHGKCETRLKGESQTDRRESRESSKLK